MNDSVSDGTFDELVPVLDDTVDGRSDLGGSVSGGFGT